MHLVLRIDPQKKVAFFPPRAKLFPSACSKYTNIHMGTTAPLKNYEKEFCMCAILYSLSEIQTIGLWDWGVSLANCTKKIKLSILTGRDRGGGGKGRVFFFFCSVERDIRAHTNLFLIIRFSKNDFPKGEQ